MKLDELTESFQFFDDWEDKYRFIIDLGKQLPNLDEHLKTDENLVRGCQSQVWLVSKNNHPKLCFLMDSDAFIVRGLIAITLSALNNKSPQQILEFDIFGLFAELDLLAHLSPSRGNGLRSMIERIRQTAQLQLQASRAVD